VFEEIGQSDQHFIGVEPACNRERQTWAAELVDYREHLEGSAIDCTVDHEIMAHAIGVRWPKPDTRTVIQPQALAVWLLGRYFKVFHAARCAAPAAINSPDRSTQQPGPATIAIVAIAAGQLVIAMLNGASSSTTRAVCGGSSAAGQ
jgi:hypothetical protein